MIFSHYDQCLFCKLKLIKTEYLVDVAIPNSSMRSEDYSMELGGAQNHIKSNTDKPNRQQVFS